MGQAAKNILTWSQPHSIGRSDFATFGSTPAARNAILVAQATRNGEEGYEIVFNDGSLRQPTKPFHATVALAKAHAQRCMSLPISERGLRSLAINARIEAERLAGPEATGDDLLAAAQLVCARYPHIDPATVAAQIGA